MNNKKGIILFGLLFGVIGTFILAFSVSIHPISDFGSGMSIGISDSLGYTTEQTITKVDTTKWILGLFLIALGFIFQIIAEFFL